MVQIIQNDTHGIQKCFTGHIEPDRVLLPVFGILSLIPFK